MTFPAMSLHLSEIITAPGPAAPNQSLDAFCRRASLEELLAEGRDLEAFRRRSENLYERVRALFFLYAIHRFHLPPKPGVNLRGFIPFQGHAHLLQRRFEEAIKVFLGCQEKDGPSDAISSALAAAYHQLGIQTLADQVRRSVRSVRGNQWMFRMGHPADQPLRIRQELLQRGPDGDLPGVAGADPGAHGPDPQRLERHFFSGHGLPRGRKSLECFH